MILWRTSFYNFWLFFSRFFALKRIRNLQTTQKRDFPKKKTAKFLSNRNTSLSGRQKWLCRNFFGFKQKRNFLFSFFSFKLKKKKRKTKDEKRDLINQKFISFMSFNFPSLIRMRDAKTNLLIIFNFCL